MISIWQKIQHKQIHNNTFSSSLTFLLTNPKNKCNENIFLKDLQNKIKIKQNPLSKYHHKQLHLSQNEEFLTAPIKKNKNKKAPVFQIYATNPLMKIHIFDQC